MLLLAGLPLAGCADGSPGSGGAPGADVTPSASARPPLSSTTPPTLSPPLSPAAKPPTEPSDLQGVAWREGTVTAGGTGPCYGFLTDDGAELALYSEAGLNLTAGARLTVKVSPAAFTAECGPGLLMRLLDVEGD